MNKLTDEQILALAANAIGHETCGVFAIDRGNYYALDGAALITIGRAVIAAHEATLAAPATDPICDAPPPSLELVEQWLAEIWHEGTPVKVALSDMHIATRASQWAAAMLREHSSAKPDITPKGQGAKGSSAPVMERSERCVAKLARTMEVCPTCGNKRCPRATDRNLPCTNSNEPGQPGSKYNTSALRDHFEVRMTDELAKEFEEIQQTTGLNGAEVFRRALALYKIAKKASKDGEHVILRGKDRERELVSI